MFIDAGVFKKMVKVAYASRGLSVARNKKGYVIAGKWWCLRVRADAFPAKAKAAVIELVSEFPQKGEKYIAYKAEEKYWDGFDPRWEGIAEEDYKETPPETIAKPIPTCLQIQTQAGMFWVWQEEDGRLLFVPSQTEELIDRSLIDRNIETEPDEPICLFPTQDMSDTLYFKNNACELWISCAREVRKADYTVDLSITENLKKIKWQQSFCIEV